MGIAAQLNHIDIGRVDRRPRVLSRPTYAQAWLKKVSADPSVDNAFWPLGLDHAYRFRVFKFFFDLLWLRLVLVLHLTL